MSTDLVDFLYIEAKEKAFEIEIETRKEYELKKRLMVEAKGRVLEEAMEREDQHKLTEFKQ